MATRTVTAPNINCGHCVETIQMELADLAGVTSVDADVATKRITVEWDPTRTSWDEIRRLLREINYPPTES